MLVYKLYSPKIPLGKWDNTHADAVHQPTRLANKMKTEKNKKKTSNQLVESK